VFPDWKIRHFRSIDVNRDRYDLETPNKWPLCLFDRSRAPPLQPGSTDPMMAVERAEDIRRDPLSSSDRGKLAESPHLLDGKTGDREDNGLPEDGG